MLFMLLWGCNSSPADDQQAQIDQLQATVKSQQQQLEQQQENVEALLASQQQLQNELAVFMSGYTLDELALEIESNLILINSLENKNQIVDSRLDAIEADYTPISTLDSYATQTWVA